MKRDAFGAGVRRLAAIACIAGLPIGAAACGDDEAASGASEPDAAEVAFVTSGSHTDSSFVQSWWEGTRKAEPKVGDRAELAWNDGLNSLDALDRAAGAALTEGADTLFFTTSEAPQLVTDYAGKFDDAWVCGLEVPRTDYPANVCTMMARYWEGAFVAGALAALVTKSDHIGVVSAFDIPIQNLQVEGYVLGARFVNPDVKIERAITESLIDSGKARAAAHAQFAAGADVILSAVDAASQGIYLAAQADGGWVIPQYSDQYESAPDVVLTSVLYRHDEILAQMIETAVDGELEPQSYEFGLKELGVGELAPFRGAAQEAVPEQVRKRVEEIQQQVIDGTITLPGADVFGKRGAGDEIDPASLGGS